MAVAVALLATNIFDLKMPSKMTKIHRGFKSTQIMFRLWLLFPTNLQGILLTTCNEYFWRRLHTRTLSILERVLA